jgi:ubiquinone/menaquinone biosynthesis C-methylase UbiE
MANWYLESEWKCRELQRDAVYNAAKGGRKILDIGSGMGRTLRLLNKSDKLIIGVDVDKNLIKQSVEINKNINYVIADAAELPLKMSAFDTIILENVIEHIKDQKGLVNEMYRVLGDGGKAVISTPNKFIYRLFMYLGKIKKLEFDRTWLSNPVPDHVAELTPKSARRLLSRFSEVRIRPINPYIKTKIPGMGIELLMVVIK